MSSGPYTLLRDEPERLEGIAPGIDRAHLRRLRKGEVPVDDEVDLHGLDRREAAAALRKTLERSIADGGRCVRVIHGRGGHSSHGGPVLRSHLVGWLSEPTLARHVMAFASGLRERGGATYVMLRRKR